jgi:hypothetical protein
MTQQNNDTTKSVTGCLLVIIVVFIIPILLYRTCGGDPADDIKNKRNFEKLK